MHKIISYAKTKNILNWTNSRSNHFSKYILGIDMYKLIQIIYSTKEKHLGCIHDKKHCGNGGFTGTIFLSYTAIKKPGTLCVDTFLP